MISRKQIGANEDDRVLFQLSGKGILDDQKGKSVANLKRLDFLL
jgi:hypothetical protein